MGADDKLTEKADAIEKGVEEALGSATDDEQTHSENDQTKGPPTPPEQRDEDAFKG